MIVRSVGDQPNLKSIISDNFQPIFIPKSAIKSQRVALSDDGYGIFKLVTATEPFEYLYYFTFLKLERKVRTKITASLTMMTQTVRDYD